MKKSKKYFKLKNSYHFQDHFRFLNLNVFEYIWARLLTDQREQFKGPFIWGEADVRSVNLKNLTSFILSLTTDPLLARFGNDIKLFAPPLAALFHQRQVTTVQFSDYMAITERGINTARSLFQQFPGVVTIEGTGARQTCRIDPHTNKLGFLVGILEDSKQFLDPIFDSYKQQKGNLIDVIVQYANSHTTEELRQFIGRFNCVNDLADVFMLQKLVESQRIKNKTLFICGALHAAKIGHILQNNMGYTLQYSSGEVLESSLEAVRGSACYAIPPIPPLKVSCFINNLVYLCNSCGRSTNKYCNECKLPRYCDRPECREAYAKHIRGAHPHLQTTRQ